MSGSNDTHGNELSASDIADALAGKGIARREANQYAKLMLDAGFDTVESLSAALDEDMDDWKMKTGHKRLFKQLAASDGFDPAAAAAAPAPKKRKSTKSKIDGKKSGGGVARHVKQIKRGRVALDQGIFAQLIKTKTGAMVHDGTKFADARVLEEGDDIWDAVLNQTNMSGNNI